jgi:hypothetical protein
VVLARYQSPKLKKWIEEKLEGWLGLEINREKTRQVNVKDRGATLDFLGYSFRYERDLKGRPWCFLNSYPSNKSLEKERDKIREMTCPQHCWKPVYKLIGEMNEHLAGWKNYFQLGYFRREYRKLNDFIYQRVKRHLRRRSQRGYKIPRGMSVYADLQQLGLQRLWNKIGLPVHICDDASAGKPCTGKRYTRFDEGGGSHPLLLYWLNGFLRDFVFFTLSHEATKIKNGATFLVGKSSPFPEVSSAELTC